MKEAMGWSRSSISSVGLLNWVVMGLGGVLAGFVSDRIGTRAVVLVGSGLLGLGLVLSSQVTALWQLYVTFGILVAGGVSAFYVPLTVLAIRWFGDRRGMAASVVSAGNGAGILLLSPLTRWLVNELDWRTAFLILGDLAWLVVIPAALLLRDAPNTGEGLEIKRSGHPRMIFRSGPFWAIALTHFACCAAHSGPIFHIVTHAIDQGVARMSAAGLVGGSWLFFLLLRGGWAVVGETL